MNFFKKNRARAAVLAVIIIAASLFGGTLRSLNSLESRVEREYRAADKYGESVKDTAEALSLHLNSFIGDYAAAMGEDGRAAELREISKALSSADGTTDNVVGISRLRTLAADMREQLELADKYDGAVRTSYAELDNDLSILKKYDAYNKAAARCNEAAKSFTGRLFNLKTAVDFS